MNCKMNIFIPYIFTTIGEDKIKHVIENQELLGTVEKIDIIEKFDGKTGKPFNLAYVHMSTWNHTQNAVDTINEIKNNGKKIVYYTQNQKGPYWSLVESTYKNKKHNMVSSEFPPPLKLVRHKRISQLIHEFDSCPCNSPVYDANIMPTAINLTSIFDSAFDSEFENEFEPELETDGLVHESYVVKLETEIETLRHIIHDMHNTMIEETYGCGV